jgi:hypothetical protein
MSHAHRLLLKWARFVHVYMTLFGLLLVLFFAVTGFILNHDDWFGCHDKQETTVTGLMPTNLLQQQDRLMIVETLRRDFGVSGVLEQFEQNDLGELDLRFKSSIRESEVSIRPGDGSTTVTHYSRGILGVLTVLHRGEASGQHTGPAWSLVIDGVAILLLTVSVTGLILWSSLRSRGQHGLAVIGMGLALCVGVYLLFVP